MNEARELAVADGPPTPEPPKPPPCSPNSKDMLKAMKMLKDVKRTLGSWELVRDMVNALS